METRGRPRVEHKMIDGVDHKYCKYCDDWLPLDSFYKNTKSPDGVMTICKACQIAGVSERNRRKKLSLIEHKGGKCTVCGLDHDGTNQCIFDFHHIGKKDFDISMRNYGLETLKKELVKCVLVCSNCHRMIHHGTQIDPTIKQ